MKTLLSFLLITAGLLETSYGQDLEQSVIYVEGTASINAVPDHAILTVGIVNQGDIPKQIKAQNDKVANQVFQLCKQLNIEDKDVQTSHLQLSKNYDYNSKTYSMVLTQSIAIHLRKLNSYEALISGLMESGINRIDGIQFLSSDIDRIKSEARKLAIKNARDKAVEMAGTLGQKVGLAVYISENHMATPLVAKMAFDSEERLSNMQTIGFGELVVSAQAQVRFRLLE